LVFWIPDSKTPSGRAELLLTTLAAEAFADQMELSGRGEWLFPSEDSAVIWRALRSLGVRCCKERV
jgi:hypothetical protein